MRRPERTKVHDGDRAVIGGMITGQDHQIHQEQPGDGISHHRGSGGNGGSHRISEGL